MRIDADRLRQLREQRAWSQEQLAEIAGLSTRTVQRVERGERALHETRMALAAALVGIGYIARRNKLRQLKGFV